MTTTTSAPTGTPTTPPPEHPDAQQLAAFLEGRLEGDVKARVVAHLARCGDCAEVFADAAAFQAEEEAWDGASGPMESTEGGGRPDNVLRFPRSSRFWMIGTLVAAGLTVLLLQTPTLRWLTGASTPASPGVEELGDLEFAHDWNRTRSRTGYVPTSVNRRAAFRLGVRLVEWRWTLAAETPDVGIEFQLIRNLTSSDDWDDRGGLWESLETQETLADGAERIESKIDSDPALRDAFDFGQWIAWAHLLSHREDPEHLIDHPDYLVRAASLANQQGANLDEATLADLRSGSPSPETWQAVRDAIRITLNDGPGDAP